MSTIELPHNSANARPSAGSRWSESSFGSVLSTGWRALGSLKLTVTLFSLAFVLIVVGTLAQAEKNMWQVLNDYFRTWVAWVEFHVFLPPSFFPKWPHVPGGFLFPGGKTIGFLMMLNLVAAHATRFKPQGTFPQRLLGWSLIGLGLGLTLVIVLASSRRGGVQGEPLISYDTYWQILRGAGVAAFAMSLYHVFASKATSRLVMTFRITLTIATGALCMFLMAWGGSNRLGDSSMRILWQLGQSLAAAGVVLAGALVLFRKRGGVVVIHLGVALLMIGELIVGLFAVEQRISLMEGEATNFARQANALEIAVVDTSHADFDDVTAIPLGLLQSRGTLDRPDLPFKLELLEFYNNSTLTPQSEGPSNPATAGNGLRQIARATRTSSGADSDQRVDVASAYVRIIPTGETTGDVYLLSQWLNDSEGISFQQRDLPETVTIGDRSYQVSLRARRLYKPYTIELVDAHSESYLGTTRPKDYSSRINLIDNQRVTRLENYRIWMNNPLRYGGETFYQSGFHSFRTADGKPIEGTTLAVVNNQAWMVPYVACAFALVGMLVHFGNTLSRFLRRQSESVAGRLATGVAPSEWLVPAGVVAMFASLIISQARPTVYGPDEMDLAAFGRLPVMFEGRIQPIDTLARNTLKAVSNKQSYRSLSSGDGTLDAASGPEQPAVRWLLDVATQSPDAEQARVFRIENLAVQELLGVPRRKGLLYSVAEIAPKIAELQRAAMAAAEMNEKDPTQVGTDQHKMIEMAKRARAYLRLRQAFEPTPFPPMPTSELRESNPEQAEQQVQAVVQAAMEAMQRARSARETGMPLIVPGRDELDWLPFGSAIDRAFVSRWMQEAEPDARVVAWTEMLGAYTHQDAPGFNRAVMKYQKMLDKETPASVHLSTVRFEHFFNHARPLYWCMTGYVLAFFVGVCSWLGWYRTLNRVSFWLMAATFGLHTAALIARMIISNRPPVIDLHSSAIFIGWAFVGFSLVIESIFRFGLGHLLAAIVGFTTLFIAHNLGLDGDTFTVLQAVLDTQFWLSTHVVTITLGYGATFVAGAFAIAWILNRWLTHHEERGKQLSRIVYGTLCFALFFSFVGTVLGGLWADDSWGRFWGWDPKENGALMIVLWNAIILHARWGGMIKERGVAVLAVLGNVVTAWSWFGVNELGIGLHAYGFTEGTKQKLALFALSQLVIAALGLFAIRMAAKSPQPHSQLR